MVHSIRHASSSFLAVAAAAVVLSSTAPGQEPEEPPPDEGRRKKGWMPRLFGGPDDGAARGGPLWQRKDELARGKDKAGRGMMRPDISPPPAQMALSGGSLYLVVGARILRLDGETLAEQAAADIPDPRAADEAKRREGFLARFDRNEDGVLTADELDRPEMIEKLDRDGDGRLSVGELPPLPQMTPPPGATTMLVEGASVYVFRDGTLCRFDALTLELRAQAKIEPPPTPRADAADRPGKRRKGEGAPWDKGGMRGGKGGLDREPPPPPPEEPMRF